MARILPEAYEDLAHLDAARIAFGGADPFPSEVVLDKIQLLDQFPLLGPLHPDSFLAQRGYRKLTAGRWVFIYRLDAGEPAVHRVFHQRSDAYLR